MKTNLRFVSALLSLAAAAKLAAQPQPGTVLWSFDVGRSIRGSLSVGFDGTVYVASDIALYAITNNGTLASNKWVATISTLDSPAIGPDGTLYLIGGSNIQLQAFDQDGTTKWVGAATGARGTPAIGFDGTVYFVADGRLYAVQPSGIAKWDSLLDFAPSVGNVQSPVVGSDGTIYVVIANKLYAVNQTGAKAWSAELDSYWDGSPALGAGDAIFVSAGPFYAFRPDGTNLWAASPSSLKFDGPPIIGKDGKAYVAGYQTHTLHAFDPTGELVWQTASNAASVRPSTAPAVDRAGNIYYCVSNSVIALNPQGQFLWTIYAGYTIPLWHLAITSPTIGPDGTLYAALGSTLYAIATGTNGPADSPWPMYRQNAQHTGKIEKPALKQPKKRADANFEFQLYGQLGQTNLIETTTNLNTWTSLTSIVVTTVPQPVVDLTASNSPSRFYRTVSP